MGRLTQAHIHLERSTHDQSFCRTAYWLKSISLDLSEPREWTVPRTVCFQIDCRSYQHSGQKHRSILLCASQTLQRIASRVRNRDSCRWQSSRLGLRTEAGLPGCPPEAHDIVPSAPREPSERLRDSVQPRAARIARQRNFALWHATEEQPRESIDLVLRGTARELWRSAATVRAMAGTVRFVGCVSIDG